MPRLVLITTLAMLAFAANSLLCRVALRDTTIDAASFTAIRLASGAAVLALLVRARNGRPMEAGSWAAAACLFGYAAFFSFAYRQLSAGTGAILLFGAVQTAMLSWGVATGERLRRLQIVGLLMAVGGLVYMLLPGISAPPLLGAAFMIASGISWAGYSLIGRGTKDPVKATAGNFLRTVPFAALLFLSHQAGQYTGTSVDHTGVLYAVLSGAIAGTQSWITAADVAVSAGSAAYHKT